jgi:hypothetical protein
MRFLCGVFNDAVPQPSTFVLTVLAALMAGSFMLLEQFRHRVAFEKSSQYFSSSDG